MPLLDDYLKAYARLLREGKGLAQTGASIATSAAMQPVAGIAGLAQLLRGKGLEGATSTIEDVGQLGQPELAPEAQRNLEGIGKGVDWALTYPRKGVDIVGEASPAAGAALAGAGALIDPTKVAKGLRGAKAARAAAKAIDEAPVGPLAGSQQTLIPGLEPLTTRQRFEQAQADKRRLVEAEAPEADIEAQRGVVGEAGRAVDREVAQEQFARMRELRAGRSPTEGIPESLAREQELLRLKMEGPIETPQGPLYRGHSRGSFSLPDAGIEGGTPYGMLPLDVRQAIDANDAARQAQMPIVRELRRAKHEMLAAEPPPPSIPNWAEQLTELPTTRGIQAGGTAPAGSDWWHKELRIDPDQPPSSVAAFLRAVRDQEPAFTYGLDAPPSARSLDDFAAHFGDRAGKRIDVDYRDSDDYGDEPYKIEVKKTHGRGEVMRDEYGDYKMKYHEEGDSPMYDDYGDVKKVEDPDTGKKVKRVAEGGEIKRTDSGDYVYRKSRGGEPYRDERGNIKYTEEENPDYRSPEEDIVLRHGRDEIKISDMESGEPTVYAMDAGKSGALLYQTLLAHASRRGYDIGASGLTDDNALRMLSNTLANYARTGTNPRDVSNTASGLRPRARGQAEGDRIWQALAGETDARIRGQGGDPDAVQFDGKQFTVRGEPATPDTIADKLDELSPNVSRTKVGQKTVMQNAVYKWLEKATPEQAEEAARQWPKIGSPLFGIAGALGVGAVANKLREDAREDMR